MTAINIKAVILMVWPLYFKKSVNSDRINAEVCYCPSPCPRDLIRCDENCVFKYDFFYLHSLKRSQQPEGGGGNYYDKQKTKT